MPALMRSFRADPRREEALLRIQQEQLPDGAFVSVEHGLRIRLDDAWNPVAIDDLLHPQTAFMLEKGDGRWMIQLLHTHPAAPGDARDILEWLIGTRQGGASTFGEPYAVALENLDGAEAWIVDEEGDVFLRDIAFVYGGYGYCGSFMRIKPDDAEARPFMDAAIRSLSPAESKEE